MCKYLHLHNLLCHGNFMDDVDSFLYNLFSVNILYYVYVCMYVCVHVLYMHFRDDFDSFLYNLFSVNILYYVYVCMYVCMYVCIVYALQG